MQRISFGFGRGCSAPTAALFPASRFVVSHVRCPQDVDAEDFFRVLAGSHDQLSAVRRTCMQRISFGFGRGCSAETTGRFSDDGALRTTRAGLVSASGRPRRASAEKMPVAFRAAQIQKKSSLPSLCPASPTRHSNIPLFHQSSLPSFHPSTP